jgi:endonuclease G, mitochondrial
MQYPESITAAAQGRIVAAKEERERVVQALLAGRPLDAEPDMARKVGRFQAAAGVNHDQAVALAQDSDPAAMGLVGEARLGAERIQGKTRDFMGVSFLDLARAAARTVGRVVFPDRQPQGSGFMISDRLFLTNNHVIANPAAARHFLVEFDYELDIDGRAKAVTTFRLAPQVLFITAPEDDLDFTVVAIGDRAGGSRTLGDFGFCPLLATTDKHILGEFVNVIQHPEGDFKQVVVRENAVVSRLATVLHYLADTQPGSSGSPVFNDQWEVIALHHWGEPFLQTTTADGRPVSKDVNEGVRISAIARRLATERTGGGGAAMALLDTALKPRFRFPSTVGERTAGTASLPSPDRADGRGPRIGADGSATWTVPLEISIRVGGITAPAAGDRSEPAVGTTPATSDGVALTSRPASEKLRIDRPYTNRRGYTASFLPGHRVELPRLSAAQEEQAARKLEVADGEDPFELKYQHFSIVMNAARRMAFFTATNIDGSTWVDIDRDTGLPREAEAREVWFDDPRVAAEAQCAQDLYDEQRPRRVFDRGHLVRRQDPTWGTPSRATRANADTFHFTNCTPQESLFNQRAQFWQGIENYVLDNAKAEKERVIVFTGPVFAGDDPPYRYVHVPMSFWKVLVRVEDGELLATALLASQAERIQRLPEGLLAESFDELGAVAQYQTSVREVERLTGLDFGSLRDHDTFRPGPEESISTGRRLAGFRDVRLDVTPPDGERAAEVLEER